MPPHVFRVIADTAAIFDEEADLTGAASKGEDTKDHIAFEIRRLAHWATTATSSPSWCLLVTAAI